MHFHHKALRADFAQRYHIRIDSFLEDTSWNELWAFVEPLLYSPYSHLSAAIRGWVRPPEPIEEAAFALTDFYRAAHAKKNAANKGPTKRPWAVPRPEQAFKPARPREEIEARRAKLRDRLGIADN